MSQFPADSPEPPHPTQPTRPPASTLTITSLLLGLAAILCIPLGLVAVILGFKSLRQIKTNPQRYGGRALALTGILTGIVGSILSVVIITGALLGAHQTALAKRAADNRARELANRTTCAANLRGIGRSLAIYAAEYNDYFPYISSDRGVNAKPATDTTGGGIMFDMFYLVGVGQISPNSFLCKSDPAATATSKLPVSGMNLPGPGYTPTYWAHPSGGNPNFCYSYSFANPFASSNSIGPWWRNTVDAALPIGADLNPGNQNRAATKNSLNHQGEGQNILFGDSHVEFLKTPAAGENGDHIYTSGGSLSATTPGTPGSSAATPRIAPNGNIQGSYDTWLVPAATDANHTRQ